MTPRLTKARYLDGYRIELTFEDGKCGILDLKGQRWAGVFKPLKDLKRFKAFRIDREWSTIEWPTGADLAPEFLYEQAMPRGNALRTARRAAPRTAGRRPRRRRE